jgi:hypothetical protein
MATDLQLDALGSTTLDASGNGRVSLGPSSTRAIWNVTTVAVSGSSTVNIPTATVSLGSLNLGGTYSGTSDSDNVNVMVYPGQQITVVWTAGDAGAAASAYVYGTIQIWGR